MIKDLRRQTGTDLLGAQRMALAHCGWNARIIYAINHEVNCRKEALYHICAHKDLSLITLVNSRLYAAHDVYEKKDDKLAPRHTNFDTLMDQLCPGWGFCGSVQKGSFVHVTDLLPKSGMVSALVFVECVMLAEGEAEMAGPQTTRWRQRIETAFVAHMESDEVDASRLRYSEKASDVDGVQARRQRKDVKRTLSGKEKLQ